MTPNALATHLLEPIAAPSFVRVSACAEDCHAPHGPASVAFGT